MTLISERYTELYQGMRLLGITEVEHETLLRKHDEQVIAQTGEQVDGELFIKRCEQEQDMLRQQELIEVVEAKRSNRVMYWDEDRVDGMNEFESRRFKLIGHKSLHVAGFAAYPPNSDLIALFNERFIEKPDDFTFFHRGEDLHEASIRLRDLADDIPVLVYINFGVVHLIAAENCSAVMSSVALDTFTPRQSKRKEYENTFERSLSSPMVYDMTIDPDLNQNVINTAACYIGEHHPILATDLMKGNIRTSKVLYKL